MDSQAEDALWEKEAKKETEREVIKMSLPEMMKGFKLSVETIKARILN